MPFPSLPDAAAVLLGLVEAVPPDLAEAPQDIWHSHVKDSRAWVFEVADLLGIELTDVVKFLFPPEALQSLVDAGVLPKQNLKKFQQSEFRMMYPPPRWDVREAAAEARAKLNAHLEAVRSSLAPRRRGDPAMVLREKYRTTNKLIQFSDRAFQWVRGKTAVVAASREQQDVVAVARTIRGTTKAVDKPPPSAELVADDLQEMARALDPVFTDALRAAARYCLLGWMRVEGYLVILGQKPLLLELWLEAWRATVDYAEVALVPAMLLRSELAQHIKESSAERRLAQRAETPAASVPVPESEDSYRFERVGKQWSVNYGKDHGFFPDLKGMRHIAQLLKNPHKPLRALDLVGGDRRGKPPSRSSQEAEGEGNASGGLSFQPAVDPETKAAVEARLNDLTKEIDVARKNHDDATLKRKQTEFYKDADYLQQAKGLRGQDRQVGPGTPAERARLAVRRALDRAYKQMEEGTPPLHALGAHLRASIVTEGTSYAYRPDRADRLPWQL